LSEKEIPLFEYVEIADIPKTHRGKQNPLYDDVLKAFRKAKNEAVKVNCSVFEGAKPTSIAHTFRMRIKEAKLKMSVQLDAQNEIVYLKKEK